MIKLFGLEKVEEEISLFLRLERGKKSEEYYCERC